MSDFTEPEPMNPFDEALSAARAEGYRHAERDGAVKALDELKLHIHYQTAGYPLPSEIDKVIDQLKRAYEKGSDGNGKVE